MITTQEIAKRYAELDGQTWEHMGGFLQFEYHRQVELVLQAAADLSVDEKSLINTIMNTQEAARLGEVPNE